MTALIDPRDARDARFARLTAAPFETVTSRARGLRHSARALAQVLRRRELLLLLIRRDLKAKYKDSALGFAWSLLRPLTQFAIYYFIIGRVIGASRGIPDFAVFVFSGLTIYGLFSETVNSATGSIVTNAGLIKKVSLPREIFPLASVGSALFNFGIQLVVLVIAALALGGLTPGLHMLYAIPALLVVLIYGTALGLLLSAVNVYLRDMQYLLELVTMVLMWASPIVYSWSMVRGLAGRGWLLEVYTDNPITLSVLAFQRAVRSTSAVAEYPGLLGLRLLIAAVVGLVLLVVAQRVFARLEGNFAQEL